MEGSVGQAAIFKIGSAAVCAKCDRMDHYQRVSGFADRILREHGQRATGLLVGEGRDVTDRVDVSGMTAGVGGVRMHHTNARALNAGAGALFRLADTIHARLDARDVAYHVPGWGSSNLQNNVEIFVGFSFGLQPEASDRGGATPAPK